jgi:colanic acid/amylovoran biosynthesis glycosyltransferase
MQESTSLSSFTLLLFTHTYPYDAGMEQTFIELELRHLVAVFKNVVVIPGSTKGKLYAGVPGVRVETGLAQKIEEAGMASAALRGLLSPFFIKSILQRPAIIVNILSMKRLLAHLGLAQITQEWVSRFVKESGIDIKHAMFYSYWLEYLAFGIGLFKAKNHPELLLISRAHGTDLFEERHSNGFLPCRRELLGLVDRVFLVSDRGRQYLAQKYPEFAYKYRVGKIGTADPGFQSKPSRDGVFRIVSCSAIIPLKRLMLLVQSLDMLGREMPEQVMEWHHVGDGPGRDEIEKASKRLPGNVKSEFHGYLPIDKILALYRDMPVDLFVTVSETEGGCPISIKEAQSCGVPVVGTSVGGIPEIVSGENGILLPEHPGAKDVALAIGEFLNNPALALQKRQKSFEDWKACSSEAGLNRKFIEEIKQVARS